MRGYIGKLERKEQSSDFHEKYIWANKRISVAKYYEKVHGGVPEVLSSRRLKKDYVQNKELRAWKKWP